MYIWYRISFSCCRSGREKPLLAKLAELDRKLFQVSCLTDPSLVFYRERNPMRPLGGRLRAERIRDIRLFILLKKNVFKKKVSYTLTITVFAQLVYIVHYIVCCKKMKSACCISGRISYRYIRYLVSGRMTYWL